MSGETPSPSVPSFFVRDGAGFRGTPAARSPWNAERLHGRVITGLMAHAIEAGHLEPGFTPGRLTTDLYSLPAYGHLEVRTRVVRDGKRLKVIDAEFFSDGVSAARASCLLLRRSQAPEGRFWSPEPWTAPKPDDLPPPDPNAPGPVGVSLTPPGPPPGHGAARRWFRESHALVAGEAISPFVRLAMACDITNGVSGRGDIGVVYINSDVTLYLARPVSGEWVGLEAVDFQADEGVSLGSARLYDLDGPVGTATVCGLAQKLA